MSTDPQIRAALHKQKLKHLHARPDTLIVDELGLVHADVRVDVAVINGHLHGFEIKSAIDTLSRLPRQIKLYEECLEKLTIVCDQEAFARSEEVGTVMVRHYRSQPRHARRNFILDLASAKA